MPALEALVDRFVSEANTLPVGISVDSRFSHANWAWDLGGISFPLLADFHPRGAVAASYGLFDEKSGIAQRSTVIVDTEGVARYAAGVAPGGQRNMLELLGHARELSAGRPIDAPRTRGRLSGDATLFMKGGCRFCDSVLRAMTNLHCRNHVQVRDVVKDPAARAELERIAGAGSKVPTLVQGGKPQHESADIIRDLGLLYARS